MVVKMLVMMLVQNTNNEDETYGNYIGDENENENYLEWYLIIIKC